ncbi:MAG: hypothetical protein CL782_03685 [Chloroflexi bacterium]|nr:hypothetical protein [Chloroflexota bacterium]MBL01609.1 hypothetical protein [Chloroflexota bacterium]
MMSIYDLFHKSHIMQKYMIPSQKNNKSNTGYPIWSDHKMWGLSIAETLTWAGLFYIFPASILKWTENFNWSISEISIGFSIALIASGTGGLISGRLIDKGLARALMPSSIVLGSLLISLIPSITHLWQFYLIWFLIGFCLSGCLYQACFSYITSRYKENAKNPIVMITLFAGFASTICYPVSTKLSDLYGLNISTYIISIVLCLFVAPLMWYSIYPTNLPSTQKESVKIDSIKKSLFPILKNPIFWGLLMTFAAFHANQSMIVSQIFPLLNSQNLTSNQVLLFASLIGPMQVTARLIFFLIEFITKKDIPISLICSICLTMLALSSFMLFINDTSLVLITIFIILQGGPYGMVSILQPLLTAQLIGRINFGILSSMVGIGFILGSASGPGIAGWIAETWSYNTVLITTTFIALTGLIFLSSTLIIHKYKRLN